MISTQVRATVHEAKIIQAKQRRMRQTTLMMKIRMVTEMKLIELIGEESGVKYGLSDQNIGINVTNPYTATKHPSQQLTVKQTL